MMELASQPLIHSVHDVIHTANQCLDRDLVRQKVFDVFLKAFDHHGAIFFTPGAGAEDTRVIINNLDEDYSRDFQEYYFQFDPLQLLSPRRKTSGPPIECISYDGMRATAYYNEFLKPQEIHHKLVVYLETMEGLQGKIVLTRPARAAPYSQQEMRLAAMLSPYLANALSINDLRRRIRLKAGILNCIDNDLATGIILIDDTMRLVYMNRKAAELSRKAAGLPCSDMDDGALHPELMASITKLVRGFRHKALGAKAIPHYQPIDGRWKVPLSAYAKPIEEGPVPDARDYYMVYISESDRHPSARNADIREKFRLTQRETEVMHHVFDGLTNAEIARTLFISEITVKSHIQKIFTKVGVKNRTSLMKKIMTARQSCQPNR